MSLRGMAALFYFKYSENIGTMDRVDIEMLNMKSKERSIQHAYIQYKESV